MHLEKRNHDCLALAKTWNACCGSRDLRARAPWYSLQPCSCGVGQWEPKSKSLWAYERGGILEDPFPLGLYT